MKRARIPSGTIADYQAQRGFAIVAAIFLLVVLAALGTFMLTFFNTQQLTSAQDIQGSRAYWAARAGIEWALGKIKATSVWPICPSSFSVDGFTVTVTCEREAYLEGPASKTIYRIASTAKAGGSVGGPGYIERNLTATIEF